MRDRFEWIFAGRVFLMVGLLFLMGAVTGCGAESTAEQCERTQQEDDFGEPCQDVEDCMRTECPCADAETTVRFCEGGQCWGTALCEEACRDLGGWLCQDQ